jgi:hypothetical protein
MTAICDRKIVGKKMEDGSQTTPAAPSSEAVFGLELN